jgi:hypothetical protein
MDSGKRLSAQGSKRIASDARPVQGTPLFMQRIECRGEKAMNGASAAAPAAPVARWREAANDPAEAEAERNAAHAAHATDRAPSSPAVPPVQEKPAALAEWSAGGKPLAAMLPHALGAGEPLPRGTRRFFEGWFGADFSRVRIHSSADARSVARQVNARAVTYGANIAFAPGRYAPDTAEGTRLLAHELTHVVQQARGGRAIQRDGPEEIELEPAHRNQAIATWIGAVFDSTVSTTAMVGEVTTAYYPPGSVVALPASLAGWTPGHYPSEAAAIAAIRAAGTPGAVFLEHGRYAAYHVQVDSVYDFSYDNIRWEEGKPWTRLHFTGGANLIVTADGAVVRPQSFRTSEEAEREPADQALMPGEDNALAGYREAFGDFNTLAEGDFLRLFSAAMQDHALTVLAQGRKQVEREVERRFSSGVITPQEIAYMRHTAEYLAGIDEEMDAIPKTLPPDPVHHARFWALHERRRVVLARYPMLARVDPREFIRLSEDEQMTRLGADALVILENIDTTRDNIIDGSLNLWLYRSVVESTIAGLGIDDPDRRAEVFAYAEGEATWDTVTSVALAAFSVAFGLGAAFASGGLSIALAAGAAGLGVADALRETERWLAESAAADTALDPEASLLPPDIPASVAWIALAWIGVGFDAFEVFDAVRAVVRAGGAIEEGVQALAHGSERVARELRIAAGTFAEGETVSQATLAVVSRRVGTGVEIQEGLGDEIRVHYSVDARGRVTVDGIRCGSTARVAEILAHAGVVRLLRRYEGVLGRLRQLWDRLVSLSGRTGAFVNPFPPGSQAFESWLELKKLPEIIEARRAALGDALGTEHEALLRRDVEFLESEVAYHQGVVDQLTLEAGAGFVARAAERTAEAIAAGMPRLDGHPLIADASKYYYRTNPHPPPPYTLTRMANANVDPRTLVPDGSGGWQIAEGGLSRTEKAAAVVAAWPEEIRAAYDQLQADFFGARIVPLEGVVATGQKIGDLDPTLAGKLHEIVFEAYSRIGDPDPFGKAVSAVAAVVNHDIVIVRGTEQLRAFNYRLAFESTAGEAASGDLHHLVPLYLGGDHTRLIDVQTDLHDRLHAIIDKVEFGDGTLAPHSVRSSELNFDAGAAILNPDGTVQIFRMNLDGTYELAQ